MTHSNRICCVYFLYKEGVLIYIGQTINLAGRMQGHHFDGIRDYDLIKWIKCAPDQLRPLEKRMIRMFRPNRNLKMNPDQVGHQRWEIKYGRIGLKGDRLKEYDELVKVWKEKNYSCDKRKELATQFRKKKYFNYKEKPVI